MLRYGLEQVGVTSDYYIIDNFRDEDKVVSMITGFDFASSIVDLLNKQGNEDFVLGDDNCKDDASCMSVLNFKNFLKSIFKEFSDDELKDKKVFFKSHNGFYYDWKALQSHDGDVYITFRTTPVYFDDNGYLKDYGAYLEGGYNIDCDYEAFMVEEAYNSLKSVNDFVELVDVDGYVLGRFGLHDTLTVLNSCVFISKDSDCMENVYGNECIYSVDFKDVYCLVFRFS